MQPVPLPRGLQQAQVRALFTYGDVLQERYGRRIHLYHDDRGEKIALDRLLSSQPLGTHLDLLFAFFARHVKYPHVCQAKGNLEQQR